MFKLTNGLLFLFCLFVFKINAQHTINKEFPQDSIVNLDIQLKRDLEKSVVAYKIALENKQPDSIQLFKRLGLTYAYLNKPEESVKFTEKYIKASTDISVLDNDTFDPIRNIDAFKLLEEKYAAKLTPITFIFLYIALIGFYLTIVLYLRNNISTSTKIVLSIFVFAHSVFILENFFFFSNYQVKLPHTYLLSGIVSLTFGPSLYLYAKKIISNKKLEKIEYLHFIPVLFSVAILANFYFLPGLEKAKILLDSSSLYTKKFPFYTIIVPKLVSLLTYALLTLNLFLKNRPYHSQSLKAKKWLKTTLILSLLYPTIYLTYGVFAYLLPYQFSVVSLKIVLILISAVAFYIVYMSKNEVLLKNKKKLDNLLGKYKNSSLTRSFANELKEKLDHLLLVEKIYKESNLSLEILSQKLDTNRHNTSQIINEYFDMNYYDLINSFRIKEAINMFQKDIHGNLNIIDVVYEVGYNNKVTFNKAFKKVTSQTPSKYLEELREVNQA